MNIEHLSHSDIVDQVQHDESVGADMLAKIAAAKNVNDQKIKDAEKEMILLKSRKNQLMQGALRILKHLNKETPISVLRKDHIINITGNDIKIDYNVI